MKTSLLFVCLWLIFSQIQAQSIATRSTHLSQNGFVQNAGQFCDQHGKVNNQVKFLYAKDDFHLELTQSGFSYELIQETTQAAAFPESGIVDPDDLEDWQDLQPTQQSVCRINITLKGSNPHPEIITDHSTGTVFNYYLGKLKVENVPSYNRVTYKDIYPGIDLVFEAHQSENGGEPEYSFIVHPGADVHQIKMMYSGAGNLHLEDQQTLTIATPTGFIKETGLRGYWLEDGAPSEVSFHLKNGTLSFDAKGDKNKTLIIDPTIVWGTYFGGVGSENWDTEAEIALDHNNNVFLSGSTNSKKFIATTGAVMFTFGGGSRDMLLAKFNTTGQLLWATYFGGNGKDVAYGVTCDSHDNVLITGASASPNVMTTSGVFQDTLLGFSDVLIAKFSNDGQLIWSTLMGGPDDVVNELENGRGVICDANDNVFICGYACSSSNVSTTGAFQVPYKGQGDAFLVKFNPNGQKIWGTYFSGTAKDRAHDICFDNLGHIYMVGSIKTKKLLITGGFQTHYGGNLDAFIAKFDTSGNYYWSSYYGGVAQDRGRGVKCDGAGYIYMNGWTGASETNVIATPGAFQEHYSDNLDGFIVKFKPSGGRVWGTYLGGTDLDQFFGLTIDSQANLYMCGIAASTSGISSLDAYQPERSGMQDAMISKFDSSGHRVWSTYFGGTNKDHAYAIERDSAGILYVVINAFGTEPVTEGTYQTIFRGQTDLALFKLNFEPCTDNTEPNESFQAPHVIADSLTSGGITINGSISTSGDQDWFAFQLSPMDSGAIDTMVTITLSGLKANYNLQVSDSSNTLIATSANAGTASEAIIMHHYAGTYYIQIVHDASNFSELVCYTLQIAPSSGAKLSETVSTSSDHHLKIYPNPSSGSMTAEVEGCHEGDMSIRVFDAIGRMVFSQAEQATEGSNTFSLNLSNLNEGLYFLEVQGGNTRSILKLVIEK